jgi:hypothetical protein
MRDERSNSSRTDYAALHFALALSYAGGCVVTLPGVPVSYLNPFADMTEAEKTRLKKKLFRWTLGIAGFGLAFCLLVKFSALVVLCAHLYGNF